MEETYNLKKASWFVNPWFDVILLTGLPIGTIYLINYLRLYFPSAFLFIHVSSISRVIFFHVFITLGIVYLDKEEWKGRTVAFLQIPLFIVIAMTVFSVIGPFNLITTILFHCLIWHFLAQNYYILQLYKLRNQDYSRLDNIIDSITMIIGIVYFSLGGIFNQNFNYFGGIIYGISINVHILDYLCVLTWLSVTFFIIRQIYLFIRWKKINIFKISMVLMTILSFYYSLFLIKNVYVFAMGFRWSHNIQYMMLAYFYHRKKFKEGIVKGARIVSYLSQPGHAGLYILFFLLVSLVVSLITTAISSLTRNPRTFSIIYYPIFNLHIFFDGFIWISHKVKSIINT